MSQIATFVVLSLRNTLGVPSTKIPLDGTTLVIYYVLPPALCYFVLAVLALTPKTYAVRLALWPLMVLLALRAALSIDASHGKPVSNTTLVQFMLFGSIQSIGWILNEKPLVRYLRPRNAPPSTITDAIDLVLNFRGHGWEWSGRLYVPRETRPANRIAFVFHTFLSAVAHALLCGVLHRAVLSSVPLGRGGNPNGSTLFDESLPFLVRYLRAGATTVSTAFGIYAGMQTVYDLCTIVAVLFLRQDPTQWPPAFDAPWLSTSLAEFWGRRWHQFLRQFFLLGGYPLSLILGRAGIVVGAFLASGVLHHTTLFMIDNEASIWWNLVGFGMMAPGILAERAFHRLTGKRVGGVIGWVWTMTWLTLWGIVIFEGFTRAPVDRSTLIDIIPPVRTAVERLVEGLDEWLHGI